METKIKKLLDQIGEQVESDLFAELTDPAGDIFRLLFTAAAWGYIDRYEVVAALLEVYRLLELANIEIGNPPQFQKVTELLTNLKEES